MTLTSISRRLKRLEGNYQSVNRLAGEHARNLGPAIWKRVVQHLSDDELRLLQDVAEAMQQGSFKEQMLATDEWAALNTAYNAALNEECRKAGASSADFRRLKAG
jgi:DNA-binding GntR family transcriptional regulator